jgi:hypothetical protein
MSNVLVIFQANTEHTEQLALAVGVGAVESEANIRLRRLTSPGAPEVGHKGYGTLKEPDLLWADTVVVGLEETRPDTEELQPLLSLLAAAPANSLAKKQAWTFNATGMATAMTEAQTLVESALQTSGFTIISPETLADTKSNEPMEHMKEAGRRLALKLA